MSTATAPLTTLPDALLVPSQRRPSGPREVRAPAPSPPPRRSSVRRVGAAVALLLLVPALPSSDAGPPAASEATVRAYFFGDSLMAGTGSLPKRPVMARVAAARLGWDVEVDAWGGTGYTTGGRSPRYLDRLRLPGALDGDYDVVLLEGGTNDAHAGTPPDQLRAAVHEVVAEVRRRQPAAAVVLMGAYDPPGRVDLRREVADAAVAQAADELDLPFFSPRSGRWHVAQPPERFLDEDGLHPREWGYGVMGERLAAALAALGLAQG